MLSSADILLRGIVVALMFISFTTLHKVDGVGGVTEAKRRTGLPAELGLYSFVLFHNLLKVTSAPLRPLDSTILESSQVPTPIIINK